MYNGFDAAGKAAVGDAFSDANIDNNFATWLANHTSKLTDMLNALKDRLNSLAETISDNDIGWHIIRAGHMLGAAGSGADLFINAWIIPNILQSAGPNGRGDHTYGTAANPHKWRPNNGAQQRFISYMNSDPTTGGPKSDLNQSSDEPGWGVIDARDYVPRGTPDGAFNQNQKDWEWYLTLLNRGDITTMPYIDPATNEYVFTEDYDFSGGGSIAQFDDFLDEVEAEHGAAVKDSVGTFLDMMPVAPGFVVPFGIPIIMLESIAVAMKQNRIDQGNPYNETISNLTNLDAYRNTKIEVRINANNVKIGNPKMYEYLTTVGIPDGNGNYIKMNPVP